MGIDGFGLKYYHIVAVEGAWRENNIKTIHNINQ
jgi:hypothetical protein